MKYKQFIAVYLKELRRVFSDFKTIFTVAMLPGIVVFVAYYFLGGAISGKMNGLLNSTCCIYMINHDSNIEKYLCEHEIELESVTMENKDRIIEDIRLNGDCVLLILPSKTELTKTEVFAIEIYYNSSVNSSQITFQRIVALLNDYEDSIVNLFDINQGNQNYDLADSTVVTSNRIATFLPMLLITLMFSSSVSIITESISGERERETLATLLMTPISRWGIVLGKTTAITTICMLSALSSYLGIIFALPRMIGSEDINILSFYGIEANIMLLIILLSFSTLITSFLATISIGCKTIKEAATLLSPLAAFSMLLGASCMLMDKPASHMGWYMVPFYNIAQSLFCILTFNIDYCYIMITVFCNAICTLFAMFVFMKRLDSESTIFGT